MFLPSKLAPNAGETLIFEDTLQIQAILTLFGKACSTPAMCASTQAATKLKSVQNARMENGLFVLFGLHVVDAYGAREWEVVNLDCPPQCTYQNQKTEQIVARTSLLPKSEREGV